MKLLDFLLILIIPILITSCSEKEIKIMELSSDTFTNGALIPSEYSCEGTDLSPPLFWKTTPEKITPILHHLVANGHVGKQVVDNTVHHLVEKQVLTDLQKKKVLADLAAMTKK